MLPNDHKPSKCYGNVSSIPRKTAQFWGQEFGLSQKRDPLRNIPKGKVGHHPKMQSTCNRRPQMADLTMEESQEFQESQESESECFVEMFQAKPMGTTQSLLKRVVRDATGEVGRLEQENPVIFCDCLPRNSQIAICVAIVLAKHTLVLHMGCSAY